MLIVAESCMTIQMESFEEKAQFKKIFVRGLFIRTIPSPLYMVCPIILDSRVAIKGRMDPAADQFCPEWLSKVVWIPLLISSVQSGYQRSHGSRC